MTALAYQKLKCIHGFRNVKLMLQYLVTEGGGYRN